MVNLSIYSPTTRRVMSLQSRMQVRPVIADHDVTHNNSSCCVYKCTVFINHVYMWIFLKFRTRNGAHDQEKDSAAFK